PFVDVYCKTCLASAVAVIPSAVSTCKGGVEPRPYRQEIATVAALLAMTASWVDPRAYASPGIAFAWRPGSRGLKAALSTERCEIGILRNRNAPSDGRRK